MPPKTRSSQASVSTATSTLTLLLALCVVAGKRIFGNGNEQSRLRRAAREGDFAVSGSDRAMA
eukprot:896002-Amphidinium_carterae.1